MTKKLTKEQIEEVILNYKNGNSAGKISKIYKISPPSIYSLLKIRGIDRRSYSQSIRKYTLNESYFDIIDSSEKAYFLGFLMADAYNNEPRGVIELSCCEKDKEILDKLNNLIGSNKPIRFVKSNCVISYRIDWCSKKLSNSLKKLGCVKAKSLILEFPNINENLISHFLRGYFDGDGCISYCYPARDNVFGNSFNNVTTFTSTENFCLYLKNYLKENLDINSTLLCRHPENNNTNRTLQISGSNQVIKLMEFLYKGASIFLQRKRDKYEEICKRIIERKEKYKDIRGV